MGKIANLSQYFVIPSTVTILFLLLTIALTYKSIITTNNYERITVLPLVPIANIQHYYY